MEGTITRRSNEEGPHQSRNVEHIQERPPNAFQPYDAPGDGLKEMKALCMGNGSIEEHNAQFKMAVTKSELDSTSPAVIDYYRESHNIPLQRQILSLENPPKTLQECYDWAAKLDNNWRRMQKILGRSRESNEKKNS